VSRKRDWPLKSECTCGEVRDEVGCTYHRQLRKVREWRRANREKSRAYMREWQAQNRERIRDWQRANASKRDPQKTYAQNLLNRAVARGDVERQPCEVCGASKTDAHHEDYSRPLDVRWLCRLHHRGVHNGEVELARVA